jgi:hypothetical protein
MQNLVTKGGEKCKKLPSFAKAGKIKSREEVDR